MEVGDTLFHFDINRRVYDKPLAGTGRIFGTIIYREHFKPLKIIGETRQSWLLEFGYKAKKGDDPIKRGGFYTEVEMEDNIWTHDHRHKVRDLLDRASPTQLREVAEILGYTST
jgi:hypothetical protein